MTIDFDTGDGHASQQYTDGVEGSAFNILSAQAILFVHLSVGNTTDRQFDVERNSESLVEMADRPFDNHYSALFQLVSPSTGDHGVTVDDTVLSSDPIGIAAAFAPADTDTPHDGWESVDSDDAGQSRSEIDFEPSGNGDITVAFITYGDEGPTLTPSAGVTKYENIDMPGGGTEVNAFMLVNDTGGAVAGTWSSGSHRWNGWATKLKTGVVSAGGNRTRMVFFADAWRRWQSRGGLLVPKGFDEGIWRPKPGLAVPSGA